MMPAKHYIVFENEGVIDRRALTVMGVSSKENDKPIGMFGTGLKYAIAVCLRNGLEMAMIAGDNEYEFKTQRDMMRVDEFDFCIMVNQSGNVLELPFTTHLGKNWELWMAFRELYSNTLDEGGTITYHSGSTPPRKEGHTRFIVEGEAMKTVYDTLETIFLQTKPIETGVQAEAHPGSGKYVYYRGIRIGENQLKRSLFNYNLTSYCTLTEDRTIKYGSEVDRAVARLIATSQDSEFIERCLLAPEDKWESDISYPTFVESSSQVFLDTIERLRTSKSHKMSKSAMAYADSRIVKKREFETREPTALEKEQLDRAVAFCQTVVDIDVTLYPIKISDKLGFGVVGTAKDDVIYIASRAFTIGGSKYVAQTLLEEYVHLKYNVLDETRQMQDVLLEMVITAGERLAGAPV